MPLEVATAVDSIIQYYNGPDWRILLIIVLAILTALFGVSAVAGLVTSIKEKDRGEIFWSLAVVALTLASGYATNATWSWQHYDIEVRRLALAIDKCPIVLDAVSSGQLRELERMDVYKIREICGDEAFLHAANSTQAGLDITFATSSK